MINVRIQSKETRDLSPKITVIGVGGAGGNAVNNMIASDLQGCEFVVCNTDSQALKSSLSETKIQLGTTVTGGLGSGAKPEVGHAAAEETLDDVMQYLEGSNMAFITAGMGGGTGTGGAPVIAKACRERGILTVGVVTKPFHFEGTLRMKMAEEGIAKMQEYVDTLIVVPNQNLFRIANEKTTFAEAFKMADSVLQSGVRGVTDLMVMPGLINLDFADIRSAMLEMGKAMMGTGEATGERRAIEASEAAINNPLLDDVSMKGARGVIINVTGGFDMTLFEVDEACNRIRDEVDPNANIIFGSTFDESLDGMMRVSVVATGIDAAEQKGRIGSSMKTVNAITAQQQGSRLERAQPNTQTATTAGTPSASETHLKMPGKYTAPSAPMTAAEAVTAEHSQKVDQVAATQGAVDPESDMFEQQDLSAGAGGTMMRGKVYNDSFIPPQAVEPEYVSTEASVKAPPVSSPEPMMVEEIAVSSMSVEVSEPALTATRGASVISEEAPSTSQSLTLRPPVPGSRTAQSKKRTPSLFERFTSPLRHHDDDQQEEGKGETDSGQSSSGSSGSFAPAPTRPAQGSLNIESPSQKAPSGEDELDIPAFLRRQAN